MKKVLFIPLILCSLAFAQPKVAVGAIGEEPKLGILKALSSQLTKALVNSGKYTALDRSEAILKQLGKELAYQRSGAVNEQQIREFGQQFGVQYMCIVESSEVMGSFMLEAKLVDVETAEIASIGNTPSDLVNIGDLMAASEEIVRQLLGSKAGVKNNYGSGVFLNKNAQPNSIASKIEEIFKQKVSISEGTCVGGAKAAIESDNKPLCSEGMVGITCKANVSLVITQCKGGKKSILKGSIIGSDKYSEDIAVKQMMRKIENADFWNNWMKELEKWSKQ